MQIQPEDLLYSFNQIKLNNALTLQGYPNRDSVSYMEIYGLKGAIYADNRHDLRVRVAKGYDEFDEEQITLAERTTPYHDPFVVPKRNNKR